jgi:hypothetical protein
MTELQMSPSAAHALRWFTAGLTRARRWTASDGRVLEISKQNAVVYFVRWGKDGHFPHTGYVEKCGTNWVSEEAVVLEWALAEATSALGLDEVDELDRSITLAHIVERIDAFDKECAEAEYTDTGDVWDLLRWIREVL